MFVILSGPIKTKVKEQEINPIKTANFLFKPPFNILPTIGAKPT